MKKKIICFDLDNVICITKKNYYKHSEPITEVVELINRLHREGHYIKIFTSRYMGRSKESVSLAKDKGYNFTKKQLQSWGIKFHKLIFGKPSYDLFVDDKSIFFKKNWFINFKIKD
jgi:hydroxymethylpyrimidine pyrophosphatase-like HAD family hydrolase